MKKMIMMSVALAAASLLFSSCDNKEKLSKALNGVWAGAPEQITDTGAAKASMIRSFEFTPTGNSGEGNVTMTVFITVENTMPASDSIVTPLTITATGSATLTGVYQATNDDEIKVNLDASLPTVDVDPDAVQLNYNVLTDASASNVTALKSGAEILVRQQVSHAAQKVFSDLTEIDDIKISRNLMSCEINHKDLTFRRQGVPQNK